eukprot:c20442_g1_i2.p1 GENE.c20442_g1_i2~~c20442_g1_i2.p1  ORF type:complete len:241 (-),score=31.21 c20442_g1_i2:1830-2552(-)
MQAIAIVLAIECKLAKRRCRVIPIEDLQSTKRVNGSSMGEFVRKFESMFRELEAVDGFDLGEHAAARMLIWKLRLNPEQRSRMVAKLPTKYAVADVEGAVSRLFPDREVGALAAKTKTEMALLADSGRRPQKPQCRVDVRGQGDRVRQPEKELKATRSLQSDRREVRSDVERSRDNAKRPSSKQGGNRGTTRHAYVGREKKRDRGTDSEDMSSEDEIHEAKKRAKTEEAHFVFTYEKYGK